MTKLRKGMIEWIFLGLKILVHICIAYDDNTIVYWVPTNINMGAKTSHVCKEGKFNCISFCNRQTLSQIPIQRLGFH